MTDYLLKGMDDMTDIDKLVDDRTKTHGAFRDQSRITQRLKDVIADEIVQRDNRGQKDLTDQQTESLDMIVHKIGRIIAGDPNEDDHWNDIAGYSKIANKVYE